MPSSRIRLGIAWTALRTSKTVNPYERDFLADLLSGSDRDDSVGESG